MKYERLYTLLSEKHSVIFRAKDYPESIVMPATGIAFFEQLGGSFVLGNDESSFDEHIDFLMKSAPATAEYYFVACSHHMMRYGTAKVFNSAAYAMGYAHGSGKDAWDISRGRYIKRRGL